MFFKIPLITNLLITNFCGATFTQPFITELKERKQNCEELKNNIKDVPSKIKEMLAKDPDTLNKQILEQLSEKDREKLRSLMQPSLIKMMMEDKFPQQGKQFFGFDVYLFLLTFGILTEDAKTFKAYDTSTKKFKFPLVTNITKEGYDINQDEFVEYDNIKDLIKDLETFTGKTGYTKYIVGGSVLLVALGAIGIGAYFYNKKKAQTTEN